MKKTKDIICTRGLTPLGDGFLFLGKFCQTPIFLGKTEKEIQINLQLYNDKCAKMQLEHENQIVRPFYDGYIFLNRYYRAPIFLG